MVFKIGETTLPKKVLFKLKMDVRVFGDHIEHRVEYFYAMLVLHSIKKRIDGGHNSPMLLVNDRYSQIVFGFPNNKEIVFIFLHTCKFSKRRFIRLGIGYRVQGIGYRVSYLYPQFNT